MLILTIKCMLGAVFDLLQLPFVHTQRLYRSETSRWMLMREGELKAGARSLEVGKEMLGTQLATPPPCPPSKQP